MSNEINKLRKDIVEKQLILPKHPEIWIAENKPTIESLNLKKETYVSDEDAQINGCAYCRWECSVYVRIGRECQMILKDGNNQLKKSNTTRNFEQVKTLVQENDEWF